MTSAQASAGSRFRPEELSELRRAMTGGVVRGVLIAQAIIFAVMFVLALFVVMATATVGSDLGSTFDDVSAKLEPAEY